MKYLINEAEVKSTWAPIIESATGIKDPEKLEWMSTYCHFHKVAEDTGAVNEDVHNNVHLNPGMNVPGMGAVKFPGDPGLNNTFHSQALGSGDKPFSLLPLSMQVAAQTIGLDLVPVVPMGGPLGILTYLDFPYAGGTIAEPGIMGTDGRTAPLMIKSDITLLSGVAEPEANDVFFITDGTDTPFRATFVGRSRIDNFIILKIETNVDETTDGPYKTGVESDITIADVFNSSSSFYLSTSFDGAQDTSDDLTEVAELVKALEDHVSGFSGRGFAKGDVASKEPYLREEGESTPDNLIGLKLFNKSVEAQTVQAAAAVTREQVQDLKQYGIDAVAQVESVLINELTQTINKHILDRIFRLGTTNAKQIFEKDGTNLSLYVAGSAGSVSLELGPQMDSDTVFSLTTSAVVPTAGDNTGTLQRRILSRILAASNLIAIRGRRGAGNFAVTNGQLATALQDIAGFVPYPLSNTVNQQSGSLYPIGSIAGVNVYVDPNMGWTDTRISVGKKGDGNAPGLVFMPYLMAESVQTIAEGTMAPKIAVKSRYTLVEAGFHPQLYYYTLRVRFDDHSMV